MANSTPPSLSDVLLPNSSRRSCGVAQGRTDLHYAAHRNLYGDPFLKSENPMKFWRRPRRQRRPSLHSLITLLKRGCCDHAERRNILATLGNLISWSMGLREPLRKKIRDYLGIFPNVDTWEKLPNNPVFLSGVQSLGPSVRSFVRPSVTSNVLLT